MPPPVVNPEASPAMVGLKGKMETPKALLSAGTPKGTQLPFPIITPTNSTTTGSPAPPGEKTVNEDIVSTPTSRCTSPFPGEEIDAVTGKKVRFRRLVSPFLPFPFHIACVLCVV